MSDELEILNLHGPQLEPFIDGLGQLRMEVFREYPYLYQGTLEYEREYLKSYLNSPRSLVALVLDKGKVVGATTCVPMADEGPEFQEAFVKAGYDVEDICYFGESILLPAYRGKGLGKEFFKRREAHAQTLGAMITTFCAVDRPVDHPLRPARYQPLDGLWTKQGYVKHPELKATFEWKEAGEAEESAKTLTFWLKHWPTAPGSADLQSASAGAEGPGRIENPRSQEAAVTIDAWTFDVGGEAQSIQDYAKACVRRVEESWDSGADIVVLPEYTWAGMEPHLPAGGGMRGVAEHFWNRACPALRKRLSRPDKMVVLGTAPFFDENSQTLRNRAPIIAGGRLLTQDKLYLTPWEKAFHPGTELCLFEFLGLRMAVLICLDIEVPELSVLLRGQAIDLLLVPSATESLMGCERVTRCACARSVELGCAVVVAPLVGRCASELVDKNLGKLAAYLPSQRAFASTERLTESAVHCEGFHKLRFSLARRMLTRSRASTLETNPSLIDLGPARPLLVQESN